MNLFRGTGTLKKTCISSKSREVAFLIMNRQIWTNEKNYKTNRNRNIEGEDSSCALCNEVENTQHLIFACLRYSSEYWEIVSEMFSKWIRIEKPEHPRFYIHLYNIMYNTEMKSIPTEYREYAAQIVQESKKNIIYRRYKRAENMSLSRIVYNRARLMAQ